MCERLGAPLFGGQLGVAREELLERDRGRDDAGEEARGGVGDVLPGVGRATRDEDKRSGGRLNQLVLELNPEGALQDVDELMLVAVHVQRRSL